MKRPTRPQVLSIRITDTLKAKLERLARQARVSLSRFTARHLEESVKEER